MSRTPTPELARAGRDGGFTLPELLIAIAISGILIVSISMAFTTVLQTQVQATDRLAESKDITFVQTWVPADLSSALFTFDTPSETELVASLAALTPPISITPPPASMPGTTGLPGTNVITIVRPDLEAGAGTYFIVSYRYEQVGGKWQISRFEIRNPGAANQTIKMVGVAHEIPAPPADWNPTMAPTHAVTVSPRNRAVLRPIAIDMQIKFQSDNNFTSGGAGLSAENVLTATGAGSREDPKAPPSRCGGRMALLLDTSGSIGGYEPQLRTAANSFINSFSGTPYTLTLNGFGTKAYGMTGTADASRSIGARAPYVSLLNGGQVVADLNTRVNALTVGGSLTGGSTNWSDGLNVMFAQNNGTFLGQPYGVDQPDLIVFITDGDPTRGRNTTNGEPIEFFPDSGATQKANRDAAAAQAKEIAKAGKFGGTETIGIMVGPTTPSNDSLNRLKEVVGDKEWTGKINPDGTIDIGNAESADLFRGSFAELGDVLRSILIAECGGTVTLQKRIDTGGGNLVNPVGGEFTFETGGFTRTLNRADTSSITFDYPFARGEKDRVVEIRETTPGQVLTGAQCTAGGVPIDSPLLTDGTQGVSVTVAVDKAVSCLMISEVGP